MRARYGRIVLTFWKNNLIREMSFRGHFIVNVASEVIWMVLLLVFVNVIFSKTSNVRGWSEEQYLFLMGTHMLVTSLFGAFFYDNCWRLAEMVRTGDLDFVLLRPASAQFLLSFERVDYSSLARIPIGGALCVYALVTLQKAVTGPQVALFLVLVLSGVVIMYALLFMFAISSVWLIRGTSIDHLWFYAVSLARYPAEIYRRFAGGFLYFALVFVVPLLLVANLPANVMVRAFNPYLAGYFVLSCLLLLGASSVLFRFALRWYRSASS